jgi:hypothetical protein
VGRSTLRHRLLHHGWGRGVEVWVWPDWFVVRRITANGFPLGTACLPFSAPDAQAQKLEVARAIWGGIAMKRKDVSRNGTVSRHAGDELVKLHWPNLGEWLTSAVYDDGTKREAPTVTIWATGGQWKLSLKDRAEGLVMWLNAEKLLELLQMADLFCMADDAPWRIDEFGSADKGKRAKK